MEDAQVGDRELQATTDRKKGTRTTAMTIKVDRGREFVLLELVGAYSSILCRGMMRPCSMRSPLKPPRTPSARVSSWVRVSTRRESRGKKRER